MSEHTSEAGKAKIIRNVLNAKQTFALTQFVAANWDEHGLKQGLGDVGFAKMAEAKLGFRVTDRNVYGCRETLDLPGLNARAPRSANAEIADLQRRLLALEQRVEVYFKGCRKDAPAATGN